MNGFIYTDKCSWYLVTGLWLPWQQSSPNPVAERFLFAEQNKWLNKQTDHNLPYKSDLTLKVVLSISIPRTVAFGIVRYGCNHNMSIMQWSCLKQHGLLGTFCIWKTLKRFLFHSVEFTPLTMTAGAKESPGPRRSPCSSGTSQYSFSRTGSSRCVCVCVCVCACVRVRVRFEY